MNKDFTWRDGERIVRFGRGALADAAHLLGEGYALLTTPRAESSAPAVVEGAASVHHVRQGRVDEIAAEIVGDVQAELVVALGGGRVIDVAKAVVAARGSGRAAAIPTTLSAAEMTRVHRHATGVDPQTPRVRAAVVINDPALTASQPERDLAASAANSLGHAIEGSVTTVTSPVPTFAAHEAARLIGHAFSADAAPIGDAEREALALASLLSGYAIDASWYGLHHVLSQTLARMTPSGHGPANAAMLPHTTEALRRRRPEELAALDTAIGGSATELAARLARCAGAERLRDLGVAEDSLDACAEAAAGRAELELTPPRADAEELRALYASAW